VADATNGVEQIQRRRRSQHLTERIPGDIASSRREITVRRPISMASTSTSQSRQGDVFDTAPPSDLDIRFPALSPQPSPLNSRRRSPADIDGNMSRREDPEVDATFTDLSEANEYPDGTVPAFAEVAIPDLDSRWRETKDLVDSYMHNRQRRSSVALVERQHRGAIAMNETALPVTTQSAYNPNSEIANGPGMGEAVMERLAAVTDEVQALREQVAELSSMLSRNLGEGNGSASHSRQFDGGGRRRLEDTSCNGGRDPLEIGLPVRGPPLSPYLPSLILLMCPILGLFLPGASGLSRLRPKSDGNDDLCIAERSTRRGDDSSNLRA
jgi:hypothetical protein